MNEGFWVVFQVLGGLAVFLLGMRIMTEGLRRATGERLRAVLERSTQSRLTGLGLGSLLGFLAHSSATTVMTVGFLNAGLLGLLQSLPVFYGANIGTTLSMQLIAFRLSDFAFVAITAGFFLHLGVRDERVRHGAWALLGFGLLFWGMAVMSDSLQPHRDTLAHFLSAVDGRSVTGFLYGLLTAALVTAVIQSSGAVIGICFALAAAGVFTSLEQVYPIILGAHIGTSVTAIVASVGGNRDARRGAMGNLTFNLGNVALGIIAAPFFLWLIPRWTDDLVHQIAHVHTSVMVVAAFLFLPFLRHKAKLLRRIIPVTPEEPRRSYLDYRIISQPENSLVSVLRELGRSLDLCRHSLAEVRAYMDKPSSQHLRVVHHNEITVNDLKEAIGIYIEALTRRYLSRRQRLMIQYLTHISTDVERVGDHVDSLATLTAERIQAREKGSLEEMLAMQRELTEHAIAITAQTAEQLAEGMEEFADPAKEILTACDRYVARSQPFQKKFNEQVAHHEVTAQDGLYFSEFCLGLDRLVRHCRRIAEELRQPFFGIKQKKFDRVELPLDSQQPPPKPKGKRGTKSENS